MKEMQFLTEKFKSLGFYQCCAQVIEERGHRKRKRPPSRKQGADRKKGRRVEWFRLVFPSCTHALRSVPHPTPPLLRAPELSRHAPIHPVSRKSRERKARAAAGRSQRRPCCSVAAPKAATLELERGNVTRVRRI